MFVFQLKERSWDFIAPLFIIVLLFFTGQKIIHKIQAKLRYREQSKKAKMKIIATLLIVLIIPISVEFSIRTFNFTSKLHFKNEDQSNFDNKMKETCLNWNLSLISASSEKYQTLGEFCDHYTNQVEYERNHHSFLDRAHFEFQMLNTDLMDGINITFSNNSWDYRFKIISAQSAKVYITDRYSNVWINQSVFNQSNKTDEYGHINSSVNMSLLNDLHFIYVTINYTHPWYPYNSDNIYFTGKLFLIVDKNYNILLILNDEFSGIILL
jgi:hypothetical protein